MKQFLTLLAAVLLPFFAAAQAEVTFNVDERMLLSFLEKRWQKKFLLLL